MTSGQAEAPQLGLCPYCHNEHEAGLLKCPATDLVLPLEGRVLDGKFRLLEQLGKGGMASVWSVRNLLVDKELAIKLIRPEFSRSTDTLNRFRNEARAAGRIGHPNICDALDFGQSAIGPYIVMERLRGHGLGELLGQRKRLDWGLAVAIIRLALKGLGAAHEAGIIHRDLKPENVFIHTNETGNRVVKLMDFGVSKFTGGPSESTTEHGVLLGTPEYMAPEQAKGAANADRRTDIWAVGAILYRAVTGRNAFRGPTVAATLINVATSEAEPIDDLVDDVPGELTAVIRRCLKKDADDRFQTAEELSEALAPFDRGIALLDEPAAIEEVEPDPVETEPPGTTTRWSGKQKRSNAWVPFAGIAIAGSLVALALFLGTQGPDGPPPLPARPDGAPSIATTADEPGMSLAAVEPEVEPRAPSKAPDPEPEPKVEPEPEPEPEPELEVELDPEPEPERPPPSGSSTTPTPSAPQPSLPAPDPAGVVRSGDYVAAKKTGPIGDQPEARRYCERFARGAHLGITGWHLANPKRARTFIGKRGLKRARYWTSAAWRGKAIIFALPSGKKSSEKVGKRKARPLCIARRAAG